MGFSSYGGCERYNFLWDYNKCICTSFCKEKQIVGDFFFFGKRVGGKEGVCNFIIIIFFF
jgi:hypothetical protein